MGFLDDLLTGRGPKLETRSLSTISPEQRNALNALLESLNKPPEAYGGQLSTGLSGLENASLGALEERSRALALPDQNLEAAGTSIRDQLDFKKNTGDANEFFTNAVQNPALDDFQRTVLPQISRQFGGNDFFSTERQNSEGLARRDLLMGLTAERSRVNLDQFNQARDRALTAAGIAPSLTAAENQRTQTQIDILEAAGVKREVEQDALDRTYAEFVRQQTAAQHNRDRQQDAALTPTIENIGMTDPGNAGLINSLLGAIASGAGAGIGQGLGQAGSSLIGRLFGNDMVNPNTVGGASADAAGAVAGGVGAGAVGAGALGGAGSAIPGAAGGAAGAVPGGAVSIADMSGNILPSIPFAGGAGVPGLVAGAQPGIAAGVAGTEAANAAALAGLQAPALPGGGAGAALGGGASADAAAGVAGTSAGGLAAGLGIAALPALIMAMGGLANDRNAREVLALQQSGLQQTQLSGGTRVLINPQNGSFVQHSPQLMDQIRERWGVVPESEFWAWFNSLPKVQGNIRRLTGPGPSRGGTPRAKD